MNKQMNLLCERRDFALDGQYQVAGRQRNDFMFRQLVRKASHWWQNPSKSNQKFKKIINHELLLFDLCRPFDIVSVKRVVFHLKLKWYQMVYASDRDADMD